MKHGEMNFKKSNLGASTNNMGGTLQSGTFIVAPKKPIDMQYANDDDFWYGDKKDKRFGKIAHHPDLPPVPDRVKNEVHMSSDSLKNTGAFRKPTVNSQLLDHSSLLLDPRYPEDDSPNSKELIVPAFNPLISVLLAITPKNPSSNSRSIIKPSLAQIWKKCNGTKSLIFKLHAPEVSLVLVFPEGLVSIILRRELQKC